MPGSRALWAIGIVAALILSGLAISIVVVALAKIDPPDLSVKTRFPEHYDTHRETLGAIAYGGQAKCYGLLNPTGEPTTDGIVFSQPATLERILQANPLRDGRYEIQGTPTPPQAQPRNAFATFRSGACGFDYWADLWQTQVTVTNREPIEIADKDGVNHSLILTPIRLDEGASAFILFGHSPHASELVLMYEILPKDNYQPTALLYRNSTVPLLVENDTFAFLFEIPPIATSDEVMLLAVPMQWQDGEGRAVPPGDIEFATLHKLPLREAHVVLAETGTPAPRNVPDIADLLPGSARSYSATTLDEAFAKATADEEGETPISQDLEATSTTSFLVYEAVEPRAKEGKTKLVQSNLPTSYENAIQIAVTDGAKTTTATVTHKWITGPGNPKLIVRLSHESAIATAKPAAEAARITAAITQFGADGAVIAKSVATGTTADDAVRIASRSLSARAQMAELSATRAPTNEADALAKSAQRYLVGAAGLEAGWYLIKADYAGDALTQLEYENRAANTAMTGLLMLTGEGAIAVGVVSLAEWGAHKIGAPELGDLIDQALDEVGALITGKPTSHGAKAALEDAAGRIRTYAVETDAAVLPPAPPRDTPLGGSAVILSLSIGALVLLPRRRAR